MANQTRRHDGRHSVISRVLTPSIPLSLLIASHCCRFLSCFYSPYSNPLNCVQIRPRCSPTPDIRHGRVSRYSGDIWQRLVQEASVLYQLSFSLEFVNCGILCHDVLLLPSLSHRASGLFGPLPMELLVRANARTLQTPASISLECRNVARNSPS